MDSYAEEKNSLHILPMGGLGLLVISNWNVLVQYIFFFIDWASQTSFVWYTSKSGSLYLIPISTWLNGKLLLCSTSFRIFRIVKCSWVFVFSLTFFNSLVSNRSNLNYRISSEKKIPKCYSSAVARGCLGAVPPLIITKKPHFLKFACVSSAFLLCVNEM